MGIFSSFYYKQKLKKQINSRNFKRSFLNISEVNHIVIALQCFDYDSFRGVKKTLQPLFEGTCQISFVVLIDGVKHIEHSFPKDEIVFFAEDLVHKIMPRPELVECVDELDADVFVNLKQEQCYSIDFLSHISLSRMRVGFPSKEDVSELMIMAPLENGYKPFFEKLLQMLSNINTKKS